jgi:hypothetical protein
LSVKSRLPTDAVLAELQIVNVSVLRPPKETVLGLKLLLKPGRMKSTVRVSVAVSGIDINAFEGPGDKSTAVPSNIVLQVLGTNLVPQDPSSDPPAARAGSDPDDEEADTAPGKLPS